MVGRVVLNAPNGGLGISRPTIAVLPSTLTSTIKAIPFIAVSIVTVRGEILNSLSRGYSNAEITKVFGSNEFTVREHVVNIMAKLEASNRAEAVAIALRKSLLKL